MKKKYFEEELMMCKEKTTLEGFLRTISKLMMAKTILTPWFFPGTKSDAEIPSGSMIQVLHHDYEFILKFVIECIKNIRMKYRYISTYYISDESREESVHIVNNLLGNMEYNSSMTIACESDFERIITASDEIKEDYELDRLNSNVNIDDIVNIILIDSGLMENMRFRDIRIIQLLQEVDWEKSNTYVFVLTKIKTVDSYSDDDPLLKLEGESTSINKETQKLFRKRVRLLENNDEKRKWVRDEIIDYSIRNNSGLISNDEYSSLQFYHYQIEGEK